VLLSSNCSISRSKNEKNEKKVLKIIIIQRENWRKMGACSGSDSKEPKVSIANPFQIHGLRYSFPIYKIGVKLFYNIMRKKIEKKSNSFQILESRT